MPRKNSITTALQEVFANWRYVFLAAVCATMLFAFATYLPNFRLITSFIGNPAIPISAKAQLLWALFEGVGTSVMPLSVAAIAILSLLFGVDAAMLAYQWKTIRSTAPKSGVVGSLVALRAASSVSDARRAVSYFGAAILSFFGASGAIALLPLHGAEFGIAGIILLLFSIRKVSIGIQNRDVCAIIPSESEMSQSMK